MNFSETDRELKASLETKDTDSPCWPEAGKPTLPGLSFFATGDKCKTQDGSIEVAFGSMIRGDCLRKEKLDRTLAGHYRCRRAIAIAAITPKGTRMKSAMRMPIASAEASGD